MVVLVTPKEKEPTEIIGEINLDRILKNILGLSNSEIEIYKFLLNSKDEQFTVNEIVSILGKSRSTVERCLMKLLQLGLVSRRAVLSKNGGYTYVYFVKPIEYVKDKLLTILSMYFEKAKDIIAKLD